MKRRSFYHVLSPADRIIVAKWTRGVAALYAAIALLTLVGVAAAHYHGNGDQNQVVTQRQQHMN